MVQKSISDGDNRANPSNPASGLTQAEMTFDFDGLIQLLAGHLYSEKKVFIRELIQNGHDAIQRRVTHDPAFTLEMGRIDILTDLTGATGQIVFRDNGLGMTRADLNQFLSTIGRSGTRAAQGDTPDVIGQFGIGFLSGFVVGSRSKCAPAIGRPAQNKPVCGKTMAAKITAFKTATGCKPWAPKW